MYFVLFQLIMNKIIFIVGPTAVGKTEVSILLAKKLKGEIVSCDSMQIYKEVNIASNKPTPAQLKKIRHHLIGIVSVKDNFDVAAFNRQALKAIAAIHRKDKIPIVVGGSGLYMRVLLDGIFQGGEREKRIREDLVQQLKTHGHAFFYEKLKEVDSQAALKIHPHDGRRIIRALEVYMAKGQRISKLQKKRRGLWGEHDISIFALTMDRQLLYQRIDRRVEAMFAQGLVMEIKKLLSMPLSLTAQHIIGVKEVGGYLRGAYDLARAQYLMQRNTRHFAKRQLTWFRKDKRLHWIELKPHVKLEQIVDDMMSQVTKSHSHK